MTRLPNLSAKRREKVVGLGLQGNSLSELPLAYLMTYPNLEHVDVSRQNTTMGCVVIDFDPKLMHFDVKGRCAFLFFSFF